MVACLANRNRVRLFKLPSVAEWRFNCFGRNCLDIGMERKLLLTKVEPGLANGLTGGTLFIDEVANVPRSAHNELLEYGRLDDRRHRRINRLGSFPTAPRKAIDQAVASIQGDWESDTQSIFVDVFLVAGTNSPIEDYRYRAERLLPDGSGRSQQRDAQARFTLWPRRNRKDIFRKANR
jgi:hypothetical protein